MAKTEDTSIENYESNYLSLNIDRVQGLVFIVAPSSAMHSNSNSVSESYENQHSFTNLTKANLLVDVNDGFIIFEHTSDNRSNVSYENFTF